MTGYGRSGISRELLIGGIYKSVLGAAPLSAALSDLAGLTDADKAFWGEFDVQRRTGSFFASHNADEELVASYNNTGAANDPWLARAQYFQAPDLVWHGSKIVAMQDLVRTRFYREFLEPQDIFHTMHIVIAVEGSRVTHVMLTRPQSRGAFAAADIELAHCFALHARKAGDSERKMTEVRTIRSCLSDVIDDAGLGVAIIEPPTILFASRPFENILEAIGRIGRQKLLTAVARHDCKSTTPFLMDRPDGQGRLFVVIRPRQRLGSGVLERKVLLITVLPLDQPAFVDEGLLRRVYDLSVSEAHICSFLAQGERVEDVAEKLNVTANTARTHLKRIFEKTGTHRQVDLVRLVSSMSSAARAAGLQSQTPDNGARAVACRRLMSNNVRDMDDVASGHQIRQTHFDGRAAEFGKKVAPPADATSSLKGAIRRLLPERGARLG